MKNKIIKITSFATIMLLLFGNARAITAPLESRNIFFDFLSYILIAVLCGCLAIFYGFLITKFYKTPKEERNKKIYKYIIPLMGVSFIFILLLKFVQDFSSNTIIYSTAAEYSFEPIMYVVLAIVALIFTIFVFILLKSSVKVKSKVSIIIFIIALLIGVALFITVVALLFNSSNQYYDYLYDELQPSPRYGRFF